MLGTDYPLQQPGEMGRTGAELSPYTGEPLGISYPKMEVRRSLRRDSAGHARLARRAGAEPVSASAWKSSTAVPASCLKTPMPPCTPAARATSWPSPAVAPTPWTGAWKRWPTPTRRWRMCPPPPLGSASSARVVPRGWRNSINWSRGVSAWLSAARLFPCGTAIPPFCASLATGNPVVFKPHPSAILPVAMVTSVCREVLAEAGFDPNLVSMVADTREEPATMALLEHPATAIVDFTGSPCFRPMDRAALQRQTGVHGDRRLQLGGDRVHRRPAGDGRGDRPLPVPGLGPDVYQCAEYPHSRRRHSRRR